MRAKKIVLAKPSAQEVLKQAERYSRGATDNPMDFDGYRVPFLYSTNGTGIWFRDARHALNRSREISGFHMPEALEEMLERDSEAAHATLKATPNDHLMIRPYQREANAAVVRIPWDPVLEAGAEASIEELAPATRQAYLELAAAVADGFNVDGPEQGSRPRRSIAQ